MYIVGILIAWAYNILQNAKGNCNYIYIAIYSTKKDQVSTKQLVSN